MNTVKINAIALLFSFVQPSTATEETNMDEDYFPFSTPTEEIKNNFSATVKTKEHLALSNSGTNYNRPRINLKNDLLNTENSPLITSNENQDFLDGRNSVNVGFIYTNDQLNSTIPTDDFSQHRSNVKGDADFPELPRSSLGPQTYNMEGSEIGDAAFVAPDEPEGILSQPLDLVSPRRTYALSVNDGQVTHNDIRKDNGEYVFSYTSSDGSRREESGRLVTEPNGQKVLTVRGSYDYNTPDGQRFHVDYQADTNGYRIINNKPVGNINVNGWGKPTAGGRPVNTGKRPQVSVIPQTQNTPIGGGKPSGGGNFLVKPPFVYPGGKKPRPTKTNPSDTPAYVIPSRPITHKLPSSSIVPPRPFGSRPSKIKHSKHKRPISHIFPLAFKFPTENRISPREFMIDYYPFVTLHR